MFRFGGGGGANLRSFRGQAVLDVPVLMVSIHYAWWSAMAVVVCGMVFVELSVFIPIVTLKIVAAGVRSGIIRSEIIGLRE
jgi:hypothetical protein